MYSQRDQKVKWKFVPFACFFFRGITNPPFLDNGARGRCFPVSFGWLRPCEFKRTASGVSSSENSELEQSGAAPRSMFWPLPDFNAFGANISLK